MMNFKVLTKFFGYTIIAIVFVVFLPMIMNENELVVELGKGYCYSMYDSCYVEARATDNESSIRDFVKFYSSGKLTYEDGYSTKNNFSRKVMMDSTVSILSFSSDSSYAKIRYFNYRHLKLPQTTEPYLIGYVPSTLIHSKSPGRLRSEGYMYYNP